MRYKGKKALMKCCKSCTDKKGIKCLGNKKIIKYEGYKFCGNYNPKAREVSKRILSIAHKIEFNKRINYYSPVVKEVAVDKATKEMEPELRKAVSSIIKSFKLFTLNLGKVVISLAKNKEIQKAYKSGEKIQ